MQNSPWDPRLAPWSTKCSPWDPRCAQEFYVSIKSDKTCDIFANYDDAIYFLGDSEGTVHRVESKDRVYATSCDCPKA